MRYSKNIFFALTLCFTAIYTNAQRAFFSGGYGYTAYICNNKTVQTWGNNSFWQLGKESINPQPEIITNLTDIIGIDAGLGSFCCALNSKGNVYSWGHNFYGELGINSVIEKTFTPQKVLGGETETEFLENVKAVAVGQSHAYALLASGEVVAWGNNANGQLGNGSTQNSSVPQYVKLTAETRLTDVVQISAGGNHGYALTKQGTVYAWGDNQANQLACGNSDNQVFPQLIIDGENSPVTNITNIDGGMFCGLLLTEQQTVLGVGAYKGTHIDASGSHYRTNTYAELVNGGETPNQYLQNVLAISAGFSHSLAIISENNTTRAVAWGDNYFEESPEIHGGQIGNGERNSQQFLMPMYVKTTADKPIENVKNIQAGCGASYFEVQTSQNYDSQLFVCGCNEDGQLGFSDTFDRYYATLLTNIASPYCGNFSFNKSRTLCTPISYEIQTPFSELSMDFEWYKNGTQISNNKSYLSITESGNYRVNIIDKQGDCPVRSSEISISEKATKFQKIQTSFCDNALTFKVVGDGDFKWYKSQNGKQLGEGKILQITQDIESYKRDGLYEVFVEHVGECQPTPFAIPQKCDCNTPPPSTQNEESCYNLPTILTAQGDSVVWYANQELTEPITINNSITTNYNKIGNYTLFATQIKNACESKPKATQLQLTHCEPFYQVSGTISPAEKATIYLYANEQKQDSCKTNERGEFNFFAHQCTAKLLAKPQSSLYLNTWAGNKNEQNHAYEFVVDSDIKHILITLIPFKTDIKNIILHNRESIYYAKIFDINGHLLQTINSNEQLWSKLQQFPQTIMIQLHFTDGTSTSFVK